MYNQNLIRVYGDSLSLPRIFEGIPFFATYPETVRRDCEKLWNDGSWFLYNRSRFDATISMVSEDYRRDSINFGSPGGCMLIIQCGVCDCAPRPIPPLLRRCLGLAPTMIQARAIKLLHYNRSRIQRIGFWRNTNPSTFSSQYRELLNNASRNMERVYVINIPPTNETTEAHTPGFSDSIKLYNELIHNAAQSVPSANVFLIDVFRAIHTMPKGISTHIIKSDGHHITLEGHKLYAHLIMTNEKNLSATRIQ